MFLPRYSNNVKTKKPVNATEYVSYFYLTHYFHKEARGLTEAPIPSYFDLRDDACAYSGRHVDLDAPANCPKVVRKRSLLGYRCLLLFAYYNNTILFDFVQKFRQSETFAACTLAFGTFSAGIHVALFFLCMVYMSGRCSSSRKSHTILFSILLAFHYLAIVFDFLLVLLPCDLFAFVLVTVVLTAP